MKRLVLIRHAKSDWGSDARRDFDRPLNHRGLLDAPRVAEILKMKGIVPDLMVSSPALRAYTTARLMGEVFSYPEEDIEKNPNFYLGNPGELAEGVDFTPADVKTLFLFSHNPGISSYASSLTGEMVDMPTCCAVICEIEGEWTDFRTGSWEMVKPGEKRA